MEKTVVKEVCVNDLHTVAIEGYALPGACWVSAHVENDVSSYNIEERTAEIAELLAAEGVVLVSNFTCEDIAEDGIVVAKHYTAIGGF